jgi:hypothetical protein
VKPPLTLIAILCCPACTIYETPPPASPGTWSAGTPASPPQTAPPPSPSSPPSAAPPGAETWRGSPPPAAPAGGIRVVTATYGANCGVASGNVTGHLAGACDGRGTCDYRVDYTVIGDPAYGCSKGYAAQWRCDGSPQVFSAGAAPEAGFGAIVHLSCGGGGAPVVATPHAPPAFRGHGAIEVVAGTYGANCGAPHANKTPPLAAACSGRGQCDYRVDYTVIGDPAVGCPKDYVAEWRCGGSPAVHRAAAPPEAGFGAVVTLTCPR